jgi:hypothetical protein
MFLGTDRVSFLVVGGVLPESDRWDGKLQEQQFLQIDKQLIEARIVSTEVSMTIMLSGHEVVQTHENRIQIVGGGGLLDAVRIQYSL